MDERSEFQGEAEHAYLYMWSNHTRFRIKNQGKSGTVFEVRVKATVRKDGSVVSSFLAEYYDKEQGEWKRAEGRYEVNAASLRHPPEKGKGLTLVCPLGIGGILCLYDPEPTFEAGFAPASSERTGRK